MAASLDVKPFFDALRFDFSADFLRTYFGLDYCFCRNTFRAKSVPFLALFLPIYELLRDFETNPLALRF